MMRGRVALVVVALLLLPPAPWARHPAAAQAPDTTPEVTAVRFPGAHNVARRVLLEAIATQPTRCRSPFFLPLCLLRAPDAARSLRYLPDDAELARDAERLEIVHEIWGYPDARVRPRVVESRGGVAVEFRVDEGEPLVVERIEVRGLDALDPPLRLRTPLPLRPGMPYALPRLQALERHVRDALLEHGRPHASIEVGGDVDEVRGRATLVLDVDAGPPVVFDTLVVTAAAPLNEPLVRSRLTVRAGDPFSPAALERAERELYRLPIVERVVASARVPPGDTAVAAHVMVETRARRAFELEGAISSTDCAEAGAFWRDRYFLGGPRMLAFGLSVSNLLAAQARGRFPCTSGGEGVYGEPMYRAELELRQPWAGSARNTLLARVFASRESSPGVYVQRGFGGELSVARDLGGGTHVRLGYEPERNELDAAGLYFCGNYGICSTEELRAAGGPRTLAPVRLILVHATPVAPQPKPSARPPGMDWLPDPPPPWRHRVSFGIDGAGRGTGSDHTFRRALLEAVTTRTAGALEVAARTRAGVVTAADVLPPQLRLYSGGAETVRGAAQNLVGPRVVLMEADTLPRACPHPCDFGLIDPRRASVRPTGGDHVLEANVEARLQLSRRLQLAGFIDYARVGAGERRGAARPGARAESLLAPGVGVRVLADLGPIRLDIGYDGRGARRYPVYRETADGGVHYAGTGVLDPFGGDGAGGVRRFVRRLQLHLAIGQAF